MNPNRGSAENGLQSTLRTLRDDGGGPAPAYLADQALIAEEFAHVRRGSHATSSDQEFSWVLGWTIVGAFLPGVGLIAAGWRRAGSVVLGVLGLVGLGVLAIALSGNALDRGLALAVDPQQLLVVVVAAATVGVIWAGLIVLTNRQLSRHAMLTSGQRAFNAVLVLALMAVVAVPAYRVGDYAMIQRGVISSNSVFQGDSDRTGTRPDVAKSDPWASKPRMNVLLMGSDAGASRWRLRPDTMILASVNTKTGATVLFSLPRNLQNVPFATGTPGAKALPNGYNCGNECLLNAIWTWATEEGGRQYYHGEQAGLRATEDAVEGVTGLKVDTYVMLNLNGFRDFVDAIGKITVDVHEALPIGGNSNYKVAVGGWIKKGNNQKLDGYHALWFARSRWSTDDYSRMQRQRCVIGAVVKKAVPKTLALNFPKIAEALEANLTTGIATDDLPAWVELGQRVKAGTVTSLPFTSQVISTSDPDYPKMRRLVRKAITASDRPAITPTPGPSTTSSAAATPKATTKATKDSNPSAAQNLTAVC